MKENKEVKKIGSNSIREPRLKKMSMFIRTNRDLIDNVCKREGYGQPRNDEERDFYVMNIKELYNLAREQNVGGVF